MNEFLVHKQPLESALKQLQPFMSKDETRYYLGGIHFAWSEGEEDLTLAATDGHKLCVLKLEAEPCDDNTGTLSAIVPAAAVKTLLEILKSAGNPEMPLTIKFNETGSRMWIDTIDQKAEFKLIDGTFPDYDRVIPKQEPNFRIGLRKEQAREALRAVAKHKAKEDMEWLFIDAASPLKLVGNRKVVVVMPTRSAFDDISLPESTGPSEAA